MENEKCKCKSTSSIVNSKGEYTIMVQREGFGTLVDLPYPIWGTVYLQSKNFAQSIKDYLPAGMTVTESNENGIITLSYFNGLSTDIIRIFAIPSSLLSYPEMLSGLNTAYLKSELVYFCSNTSIPTANVTTPQNKVLQNAPLYLGKIGGMGDKSNELITPYTRRLPNNSVNDIVEIAMRNQDIKPETVWIHKFAYIQNIPILNFYWHVFFNDIVNMNKKAFKM